MGDGMSFRGQGFQPAPYTQQPMNGGAQVWTAFPRRDGADRAYPNPHPLPQPSDNGMGRGSGSGMGNGGTGSGPSQDLLDRLRRAGIRLPSDFGSGGDSSRRFAQPGGFEEELPPLIQQHMAQHPGKSALYGLWKDALKEQFMPGGEMDTERMNRFLAAFKGAMNQPLLELAFQGPVMQIIQASGFVPPSPMRDLPPGSPLSQCLANYSMGMTEMVQWMSTFMANKMSCGMQCKDRLNLQMGPARTCMAEMKSGMLKKMLTLAYKAPTGAKAMQMAGDMVAATCSLDASNDRSAAGPRDFFAKATGSAITGHMCKMATFAEMVDPAFEECTCDCLRDQMAADGMPFTQQMVDTKLGFFQDVLNAISSGRPMPQLPPEMAKHDKMAAAACLFRHCDTRTLISTMMDSGLAKMNKEMQKAEEMMKAMAPQGCRCVQQVMPAAPFFTAGNSCQDLPDQLADEGLCAQRIIGFLQRMRQRMSRSFP